MRRLCTTHHHKIVVENLLFTDYHTTHFDNSKISIIFAAAFEIRSICSTYEQAIKITESHTDRFGSSAG